LKEMSTVKKPHKNALKCFSKTPFHSRGQLNVYLQNGLAYLH
jgi:hypothetical protein